MWRPCVILHTCLWAVLVMAIGSSDARASDIVVHNATQLGNALHSASRGDTILLAPGTYAGGVVAADLTGVTIRSQDPANQAVISGGSDGLKLKSPSHVTVSDLTIDNATDNGLNIDDTGSRGADHVTLRDLTIHNIGNQPGNQGGIHIPIKLSGLNHFKIQRVRLSRWSTGGEAIDPVGSHHGIIENSLFDNSAYAGADTGTGVRAKGGSQDIVIRANRFVDANGRAIEFGGRTGPRFFRYLPGESGFEAKNIRAAGNVVQGGSESVAYVNIDGGVYHHNLIDRPRHWAARILNENRDHPNIVETKNGVFRDNAVIYKDTGSEFNTAVNVGPKTHAGTFTFARNTWYNQADPADSEPRLPADDAGDRKPASRVETGGAYAARPGLNPDGIVPWKFNFGLWLVNANDTTNTITLTPRQMRDLVLAVPGDDAKLDLLSSQPLSGDYTFEPLTRQTFQLQPLSYAVLIKRSAIPEPATLTLLSLGSLTCLRRPRAR